MRGRRSGEGGGGGCEVAVVVEEDGRGLLGDGEGLALGEAGEGGGGGEEGAEVVGVCGGQVVAGLDGLLHEVAPLLASPDCVLVVQLRGCASHGKRLGRELMLRLEVLRGLCSLFFFLFWLLGILPLPLSFHILVGSVEHNGGGLDGIGLDWNGKGSCCCCL